MMMTISIRDAKVMMDYLLEVKDVFSLRNTDFSPFWSEKDGKQAGKKRTTVAPWNELYPSMSLAYGCTCVHYYACVVAVKETKKQRWDIKLDHSLLSSLSCFLSFIMLPLFCMRRLQPNHDPRLLSKRRKLCILLCISFCVSTSSISSTIYFPGKCSSRLVDGALYWYVMIWTLYIGIPYIAEELEASSLSVTLTTALYILLTGIAPVFWGSISDYYKIRRPLVLASLVIFCISTVVAGVVSNIWALIVLRCIQATGASCTLAVGAGIIADCFAVEERGAAFSQFFYGLFVGPLVGM